jgi:hypothetical protein
MVGEGAVTVSRAVFACVGVVAAFALGTRFGGTERVEVHREPGTTRVVTETRTAAGATLTAEQVRAIVREELSTAHEPAEPELQVVEARERSAARAHDVVARAIDQGRWTEQDRDDLLTAMRDLDRAQADDVLAQLFPALNDGRVRLTYDGTAL